MSQLAGLPEPLTTPDCDLSGLKFMPLDVVRLGDSDLFALSTGDEFKAAVALWCKSWLQIPAGSLPDDDRSLAQLSGAGPKWKRVKSAALIGWIKCSDGRLYHPEISALALRAWERRKTIAKKINSRLRVESAEWAEIRTAIFKRDNYTCLYCGAHGVRLECDHVIPVSQGGETREGNLVTACFDCNRSKGSKSLDQWLRERVKP